jgi:hypothetical protein
MIGRNREVMNEIVAALFAFPTAIFTVAMGMAVLYWLLVIVGALDVDLLHICLLYTSPSPRDH